MNCYNCGKEFTLGKGQPCERQGCRKALVVGGRQVSPMRPSLKASRQVREVEAPRPARKRREAAS